jgi:cytidylate kinase
MGPTGAGKSTLLAAFGRNKWVGLVEVGKMMREKYPLSHFQGHGSPTHTQKEAWQMCLDGIATHTALKKHLIVIDGQPRNMEQFDLARALPNPRIFVHLWAPLAVREARVIGRDNANPEALKLAQSRLTGDLSNLYNIVSLLDSDVQQTTFTYDTSREGYGPGDVMSDICEYHADEYGHQIFWTPEEERAEPAKGGSSNG